MKDQRRVKATFFQRESAFVVATAPDSSVLIWWREVIVEVNSIFTANSFVQIVKRICAERTQMSTLKRNQFVAYRGPRGGRTIATVLYIFRCDGRWYAFYRLSHPNNGVRECKGLIPERLARRNPKLWV